MALSFMGLHSWLDLEALIEQYLSSGDCLV